MTLLRKKSLSAPRRGFTLIEVIVALVVGLIALGGIVQLMIVQGRGYRKQREVVDVHQTAREAAALLSWDLRQAAADDLLDFLHAAPAVLDQAAQGDVEIDEELGHGVARGYLAGWTTTWPVIPISSCGTQTYL